MSDMMSALDLLGDYFDRRAKDRAEAVERLAAGFTERELRLIREAAVMGYVLGGMGGGHHGKIPPDGQIASEVMDACMSHPDLYPTITGVDRLEAEEPE
jgi:hypothetical protein